MELGKLSKLFFSVIGGMSVLSGIVALILINIAVLTGINVIMGDLYFSLMWMAFMLGIIAVFPKSSRSFGVRGLSLGIYLFVFISVTFIVGWWIYPFP
ncbi:hypothetical protein [Solibacillus cecembensis]|uniref:hypothetical protein n=1 Tax=Solibacillus cecembensis TaxID=459347 RepID=UPI003D00B52A